ncbi:hypothetical protein AK830_g584 [Neonectria ditissima]|uniref:MARVEL domain-containing protein n=1 Tax=Neonectria ditissima TaxID=78410 RepID=A0A0P7BXY9_9HYPO|nr:hypothetical protein AK830_g584 [Neonectria ditissima]
MSTVNSRLRLAGFAAWILLFGIISSVGTHTAWGQTPWLSIFFVIMSLSLESFLLLKLSHYLPETPDIAAEWHEFFYENRQGSMVLLVLCIAWFWELLILLALIASDLFSSGTISRALGSLFRFGPVGVIIAYALYIFGVLYFLFLMAWVFWTGAKGLWRVAARVQRLGEEEGGSRIMLGHG